MTSLDTAASSSQSSIRQRQFSYDVLPPGSLRLFKLDLNGQDEPLTGQIMTTYFNWNVKEMVARSFWKNYWREDSEMVMEKLTGVKGYDTFSYTWGDQSETFPLQLSYVHNTLGPNDEVRTNFESYRNGTIQIGPNLKDLLEELRRQGHPRFGWIDAICINQANDLEKKLQIPMMRDIFEYAENGYIWLGKGTIPQAEAMNVLPTLTAQLTEAFATGHALAPGREESFAEAHLPLPHEEIWRNLGTIMKNPYWSRLWTLQEAVVFGKTVEGNDLAAIPPSRVLLRDTSTPLETFNKFSIAITSLGLRSWIISGRTDSRPRSTFAFDGLDEIRICRESWGRHFWGVSLAPLLLGTRRRKATIAADVVFGMLAMMDSKTAKSLAPESTVSTKDVFVKFAKHYIRNEHKEHLLNHIATEEKLEGLPSWVPNFASPPSTLSLGSKWTGKLELSEYHKEQMYHAGFQRKGKWKLPRSKFHVLKEIGNVFQGRNNYDSIYDTKNPRQIAVLPETDHLLVSGLHLDIVAATVECNPAAESSNFFDLSSMVKTEQWDTECLRLALQHMTRDEDKDGFDIYARTITANRVSIEISHDEAMVYDHQYQVDFVARYSQFKQFIQMLKVVGGDMTADGNMDRGTYQFADVMSRISRRRRFFATESGRIGLGPADTEIGDSVVVLFYCPTPYIIRQHPTGRHQLIGESYIHGLMYGEALEMFDQGEINETKWIIE